MTDWREIVATPQWRAACEATVRHPRCRAEMIDYDQAPVNLRPGWVESGWVEFTGEAAENWACEIRLSDPLLVPHDATDTLHPLAGLQLRLWWELDIPQLGGWVGLPIGTYDLEDPQIDDDGTLGLSLSGRDALAQARRGGYGGVTISCGGQLVSTALGNLFAVVAPRRRIRIAETAVTLPAVYDLGAGTPSADWRTLADLAGWVVRTDREGTIVCGPPSDPSEIAADWQEGPTCPVTLLQNSIITSGIKNAWMAKSTSPTVTPVIIGYARDDDEGSPTWVGRYGPFWGDPIESDAIATLEAAENMARAALEQNRHPMQTVRVSVPPRPDLNYRDLVLLARKRAAVSGEHKVSGWRMDLEGGLMDVTMMTRALK